MLAAIKKKFFKLQYLPSLLIISFMVTMAVFQPGVAFGTEGGDALTIDSGLNSTTKETMATTGKNIVKNIAYLIGVVAAGALVFCGFRLQTTADEQKRAEVKTHIMWIIVGLIITGLAFMIVSFVASLAASTAG